MENEKRPIDANKVAQDVRNNNRDNFYRADWTSKRVVELLESAPTVDAVEVVRCKDCKHSVWDEENEMWKCVESADYDEDYGEWFGFYEYHNGDFFCADGERKDNG